MSARKPTSSAGVPSSAFSKEPTSVSLSTRIWGRSGRGGDVKSAGLRTSVPSSTARRSAIFSATWR